MSFTEALLNAGIAPSDIPRQPDFHGEELEVVDRDIAVEAIDDHVVALLMTVPGIDVTVAVSIVAAVGDFSKLSSPERLVSHLGPKPKVPQFGEGPAVPMVGSRRLVGRKLRRMLVEAAFAAT